MPINVKPVADVAAKWTDVTPGRSAYYEKGAVGAGAAWQKNADAASGAFRAAVSAGNIEAMFKGGIKKAGADKFNRKVKDVGVGRFAAGVQAAGSDYANGVAPYLQTISQLDLPARQPRGSVANLQRVSVIATALNKQRLALRAAGA